MIMDCWRPSLGMIFAALGSGCGAEPDCSFEHVVEHETAGRELRDCGSPTPSLFGEPVDRAQWEDAHDCAISSSTSQQPFVVRWVVPGVEGATKYAFVGRMSGGTWSLAQFIENFNADGSTRPTIEYACAALGDQGDCADLTRTLCVTCGQGALVASCGG